MTSKKTLYYAKLTKFVGESFCVHNKRKFLVKTCFMLEGEGM